MARAKVKGKKPNKKSQEETLLYLKLKRKPTLLTGLVVNNNLPEVTYPMTRSEIS